MNKFLWLILILVSANALADNFIRQKDFGVEPKTIFLTLPECTALGDPCIQIDGVDLSVVDLVSGQFVPNATKLAAKQAAQTEFNRIQVARKARLDRMLALALKIKDGSITAAERNEALGLLLKDYIRELKELD